MTSWPNLSQSLEVPALEVEYEKQPKSRWPSRINRGPNLRANHGSWEATQYNKSNEHELWTWCKGQQFCLNLSQRGERWTVVEYYVRDSVSGSLETEWHVGARAIVEHYSKPRDSPQRRDPYVYRPCCRGPKPPRAVTQALGIFNRYS